ncbi:hypothetical protein [Thermosulfurimonas sp. F29]|uniref:hypothetical protein n=1 Tax=Thermosulfurimonas sp. F29 TaxID=2867247 RepID=UPI001C83596F|nr:hypothetical protein [Thermosulfurimonas sp. F29]MBX6423369.1 hypothetical protein [Thermosulfurimonas sp. F29]
MNAAMNTANENTVNETGRTREVEAVVHQVSWNPDSGELTLFTEDGETFRTQCDSGNEYETYKQTFLGTRVKFVVDDQNRIVQFDTLGREAWCTHVEHISRGDTEDLYRLHLIARSGHAFYLEASPSELAELLKVSPEIFSDPENVLRYFDTELVTFGVPDYLAPNHFVNINEVNVRKEKPLRAFDFEGPLRVDVSLDGREHRLEFWNKTRPGENREVRQISPEAFGHLHGNRIRLRIRIVANVNGNEEVLYETSTSLNVKDLQKNGLRLIMHPHGVLTLETSSPDSPMVAAAIPVTRFIARHFPPRQERTTEQEQKTQQEK